MENGIDRKLQQEFEQKIGYSFENVKLLEQALTHSSYANECFWCKHQDNERLEFLGDSILGMVVADHLYRGHPDLPEGELTRIRSILVCEESLVEAARELDLGSYLKLGRGEEAGGGRERQSILADATEAVFAAVYLDGGIQPVRELIVRVLLSQAPAAEERRDYKTTLQEVVQRRSGQVLTYHMLSQSGPDHNKTFLFEVRLNDESVGCGEGHSKKEAEQAAARDALEKMG